MGKTVLRPDFPFPPSFRSGRMPPDASPHLPFETRRCRDPATFKERTDQAAGHGDRLVQMPIRICSATDDLQALCKGCCVESEFCEIRIDPFFARATGCECRSAAAFSDTGTGRPCIRQTARSSD